MMEELDYDYRAHSSGNSAEANKGLAIRFYMDAIRDEEASVAAGRPIFVDTEMIEKRVRGDRNNIVQTPVREDHRREFAELYRAFKAGEETTAKGTPLAEWPSLPKSLVMELKYLGFTTVEQVSEASDHVCSKMAGLQPLKQRAKMWLELAKNSSAPLEALSAKVGEQTNELEVLRRNSVTQAAQIQALLAQLGEKTAA